MYTEYAYSKKNEKSLVLWQAVEGVSKNWREALRRLAIVNKLVMLRKEETVRQILDTNETYTRALYMRRCLGAYVHSRFRLTRNTRILSKLPCSGKKCRP